MRKWISLLMMVIMALTTAVPASYASTNPHEMQKAASVQEADHEDCHHGHTAAQDEQTHKKIKSCCDKGMCQCVGGMCHNGFSMIFGPSSNAALNFGNQSMIDSINEFAESLSPDGLKRPPRA